MSKIKYGGLDQYGAEAFDCSHLEQLALKGLINANARMHTAKTQ